jgi:phosphonoacetaldehyde hydrolase
MKLKKNALEMVILDWAGTTVDIRPKVDEKWQGGCDAPKDAFVDSFAQLNVKITSAEARGPMGNKKDVHIGKILDMDTVKDKWREAHGYNPNPNPQGPDVQKIFEKFVPSQLNALTKYADLGPDTVSAVATFRGMGMKVGSTTGYMGDTKNPELDMIKLLLRESKKRGYQPDTSHCASGHTARLINGEYEFGHIKIPEARPAPWMVHGNASLENIFPTYVIAKVDDTIGGVGEGVNAGAFSIGLAATGTYLALLFENAQEKGKEVTPEEYSKELSIIKTNMYNAGAHAVVESLGEVPAILKRYNLLLKNGSTFEAPKQFRTLYQKKVELIK